MAFSACILAGCGGGGTGYGTTSPPPSGGTSGSTSNSIAVGDDFFDPKATTVPVGTTVTWSWGGSASHNVTFDDGTKSATMASGTYTRTFTTAGSYNYHCTIHGAAMSGTVSVK